MKKKIVGLLALAVSLISFALFGGCGLTKAGTMDKLRGTYKLTKYVRDYWDGDKTDINMLSENEITMYLIINGSQKVTVVYRDKDTAFVVRERSVIYSYRTDSDGKESKEITQIRYTSGTEGKLLLEQATFYFYNGMFRKYLNYDDPTYVKGTLKIDYRDKMQLDYVNSATDLSYVSKKHGGELPVE